MKVTKYVEDKKEEENEDEGKKKKKKKKNVQETLLKADRTYKGSKNFF
jgi:hypothetical protein